MGVDVEFVVLVGVKKGYNWLTSYKNKNEYIRNGELNDSENVVFEDYFPPNFTIYKDGMCCEYSYIGRKIAQPAEYLDEIENISLNINDLQKITDEVYLDLVSLGIKCFNKEDVKLHIFCHFS